MDEAMTPFQETLRRLGLSQYHDDFVAEAFDTWEILVDITEKDLEKLGVKLGHRRILQRAIAEHHKDGARPLPSTNGFVADKETARNVNGHASIEDGTSSVQPSNRTSGSGKRKYRRHPKPDENAPERPPSAYVLFSNHVRDNLKAHEMSFTEIAKAVGERWQALAPDEKAIYESRSQAMKDRFYAQLSEYKKTPEYAEYQQYLVEFKLKHEGPAGDAKRKKEEKHTSNATAIDGYRGESSPENRASSTHSSEQPFSERRSPINGAPYGTRPPTRASERPSPPEVHKFHYANNTTSPPFSPHNARTGFASINGSVPQSPSQHASHRRDGTQQLSPRTNHPMAVSTSLAYGYMPQSQRTPTSPPDLSASRALPSNSSTLPPLIHRDSAFRASLPNRQLPLPSLLEARGNHSNALPPLTSPTSEQSAQQGSGLATLLRAGEHIASHGMQSPTIKHERSIEDGRDDGRRVVGESRPP